MSTWYIVALIIGVTFLMNSPLVGMIVLACLVYYGYKHNYFQKRQNVYSNGQSSRKVPPTFVRKIEFLSNREIVFSNFSRLRYLEENGSGKMVEIHNPIHAKVYIRLNHRQFDVFVKNNEKSEQLSFEKENIKILDISNHLISIIEGNKDSSYLEIEYNNQYFTTLEVEELMDFFKDFKINNATTKFQEKPIVNDVPPKPKKNPLFKIMVIAGIIVALMVGGIVGINKYQNKQTFVAQTLMGTKTKTKYFNGLTYLVNMELDEEDYDENAILYEFSNKQVPYIRIDCDVDNQDYTQTYDYSLSSAETLQEEVWEDVYYDPGKKQYDFINFDSGKWYHFTGLVDSDSFWDSDSQDGYVDVYVLPTNRALVKVMLVRSIEDTNDYDIQAFLNAMDISELNG